MSAPFLSTPRLDLWQPRVTDLAGLCALVEAEETRRFLGPASPAPENQFDRLLRNAGGWSLYGYGIAVVRMRGADDIVGTCGVFHSWRGFGKGMDDTPEAGWIIRHDHCGKGLAREAATAMLGWFDANFGPRRIACMIEEGHVVSDRLARSLGFVPYDRQEDDGEAPLILYERLA